MSFFLKSVYFKIMISLLICLLAVAFIYIPLYVFFINTQIEKRVNEKIQKFGIMFASSIPHVSIEDGHEGSMREHLKFMLSESPILSMTFYDLEGSHIYTYFRDVTDKIHISKIPIMTQILDVQRKNFAVSHHGKEVGKLTLNYSIASFEEGFQQIIVIFTIGVGVLLLILGVCAFLIVEKFVLKPVRHLATLMPSVTSGNYDIKIPDPSNDEIGQLMKSFSQMSQSIREKIDFIQKQKVDLESLNLVLEEKVKERTQKVTQRQEELEKEIQERKDIEKQIWDMLKTQEMITDNLIKTSGDLQDSRRDLEQRNTSLAASNRKLEDLQHTYENILSRLDEMYRTHIPNLETLLNKMLGIVTDKNKNLVRQASKQLHEIEDLLRPIASLYVSEKAIESKRVLLAESSKPQQIMAKMALSGTGVELDIVSTIKEGIGKLETQIYDVICTNIELIELVPIAHEKHPNIRSVFMTSEDAPAYLEVLQEYPFLSNIVSRNDADRTFTIKNILITIRKLLTYDLFGLEKYLNWGVKIQNETITSSENREQLIDGMQSYFEHFGFRKSLLTRCAMVSEEFLMNAIYDAPTDASGKALYNHLPRTQKVDLRLEEQGLLQYACDGMLLGISVQDPFGGFSRSTILEYLKHCYSGDGKKLDPSKGGGGFGLLQIMETADLVVFNVRDKIKTEVIALFNLDPNISQSSKKAAFHYFSM